MADEYIKREDARRAFSAVWIQDVLDIIPAADVRPVMRGKWLRRDDMPRIAECKCSACGYADYPNKNDRYWFERNFCPNCGAMMEVDDG